MALDSTFIQTRITNITAQIVAIEDAILAVSNGVESYTLDTGQSRQQVTKYDIEHLQKTLNNLYVNLEQWQNKLNGNSGVIGRPLW